MQQDVQERSPGTEYRPTERRTLHAARLLRDKSRGSKVDCCIGNEQQLAAEFGVCRSTLRAAARELERQGVIRIARGRRGGFYAAGPDDAEAVQPLSDLLTLSDLSTYNVASFAMQLYRIGAVWAAQRGDRIDSDLLIHAADLVRRDVSHNHLTAWRDYRGAIVRMAENSALTFLHAAYHGAYHNAMLAELHLGVDEPERVAQMWHEEARIFDAVAAGDPVEAHRSAFACTDLEIRFLSATVKDGMLATTLRPETLFQLSSLAVPSSLKLAHHTLRALHAGIRRANIPAGVRIGSIATLAGEYGVSIDVMRDTLLLAQLQHLVDLRRGRGGGVFVALPHGRATIDLVARHLAGTASLEDIVSLTEAVAATGAAGEAGALGLKVLHMATKAICPRVQPNWV